MRDFVMMCIIIVIKNIGLYLHRWKNTVFLVIFWASTVAVTSPSGVLSKGMLTGSISDSVTGLGIQGAHVKLPIGLETLTAISDSAEKFLLTGIPEGTGLRVSIEKCGYHTESIGVTVISSMPMVVAVQLTDVFLQLLSPDGGQLIAGTEVEIRWDTVGISALRIEYSPNGGRNWLLIANGVDATRGGWVWSVPDIPTPEGYIRITDTMRPELTSRNSCPLVVTSI